MADRFTSSRHSLIPSFLYSSSSSSISSKRLSDLDAVIGTSTHASSPSMLSPSTSKRVVIPSPNEKVEMYSPAFYAACTIGGLLATGPTHTAVTPFDVVKCNMQASPIYPLFHIYHAFSFANNVNY